MQADIISLADPGSASLAMAGAGRIVMNMKHGGVE